MVPSASQELNAEKVSKIIRLGKKRVLTKRSPAGKVGFVVQGVYCYLLLLPALSNGKILENNEKIFRTLSLSSYVCHHSA